jgi:Mn2+/Fe2+ NRAMP family transporter
LRVNLKILGPGLLFAGASIGVSHLVQSTRAGSDFGFGLIWALLLINFVKYPFFQFGPRYASATGKSLLSGYHEMSKGVLVAYIILTFASMFTIQTAVTIVTAGIASSLMGGSSLVYWTVIVTTICMLILLIGRYKILDNLMKFIVLGLTVSTILAVAFAIGPSGSVEFKQVIPKEAHSIAFLIAFMGWMPSPLDLSIWHSVWTVEKKKLQPSITSYQSILDFNVGYITTTVLGIGFVALGALVMYNSGESFSSKGGEFANQLISMYTSTLGDWAKIIIGIAAFTTMFSTTLTTLDASPRVMSKSIEILKGRTFKYGYLFWLLILVTGTLFIFLFFQSEMGLLVKIATILSFLPAQFFAYFNFRLISSKRTPMLARPSFLMKWYSIFSIIILIAFSAWFLSTL